MPTRLLAIHLDFIKVTLPNGTERHRRDGDADMDVIDAILFVGFTTIHYDLKPVLLVYDDPNMTGSSTVLHFTITDLPATRLLVHSYQMIPFLWSVRGREMTVEIFERPDVTASYGQPFRQFTIGDTIADYQGTIGSVRVKVDFTMLELYPEPYFRGPPLFLMKSAFDITSFGLDVRPFRDLEIFVHNNPQIENALVRAKKNFY
ncbi:Aste57867_8597 [Aphanomyces stellatus]|uniref:Aste57867_8597 protein n=1 Tax=Aphanomyces stellatus TaxID=120398 RepID=A0A485KKR4_9STRA|nr:hypothetical protein As57867_008565 [Aphanomyces stellatus]VFT85483.1 Aste57867_8597 [Aphanomyces stellatus]